MGWNGLRPSKFTLQVLRDGSELQRKITAAMLQGVILRSPVDTGAFRSNHRVSIGSVDYTKDFQKIDKSGTTTIADGMAKILSVQLGMRVFISNNLPYSIALENGHSGQAPLGIYSITFQSVTSRYK
ncbi:MAG: hypothetical protein L0G09_12100 [Acinetobacter sp.]|nr:hypothetical protein [Acinetobacter sp.]MDN5489287.1 hypothetical protein [Acinetobacter sp.]MDN5647642.1 hypothetical protein [Acinetobacter sp.]MDN5689914.1 hypothetical protein [Acinetobacter sp.]